MQRSYSAVDFADNQQTKPLRQALNEAYAFLQEKGLLDKLKKDGCEQSISSQTSYRVSE